MDDTFRNTNNLAKMDKIRNGLRELPQDDRDFKVGFITRLPKLEELPKEYLLETDIRLDQAYTDFCSAFSTDLASSIQEGVTPCPEWGFAKSKELSDDTDEWGQDLRTACKRHIKFGLLDIKDSPMSLKNTDPDVLRDIKNWPKLEDKALKHKKKSYFKVSGQYNSYDDIRATMWKFRNEKVAVVIGVMWSWPLSETFITEVKENGFGHAICILGWNEKGLIIQNSTGGEAGDNDRHVLAPNVVEYFADRYGAFAFLDLDPEDVKTYYLPNNILIDDTAYTAILKSLLTLLKDYVQLLKSPQKLAYSIKRAFGLTKDN